MFPVNAFCHPPLSIPRLTPSVRPNHEISSPLAGWWGTEIVVTKLGHIFGSISLLCAIYCVLHSMQHRVCPSELRAAGTRGRRDREYWDTEVWGTQGHRECWGTEGYGALGRISGAQKHRCMGYRGTGTRVRVTGAQGAGHRGVGRGRVDACSRDEARLGLMRLRALKRALQSHN